MLRKYLTNLVVPETTRTLIPRGTLLRGDIESKDLLCIDGELVGTVRHEGNLFIGPNACLHAHVRADNLFLAGELHGTVEVTGKLELLSGARLIGDIHCDHLVVHKGATFTQPVPNPQNAPPNDSDPPSDAQGK